MLQETAAVDRSDLGKPQLVAEYAALICKELLNKERELLASVSYMSF